MVVTVVAVLVTTMTITTVNCQYTCDTTIHLLGNYFQEMVIQHNYFSSNSNNSKCHYYIGSTY